MVTAESVAALAPKYKGTPYNTMDCQAYWEQLLYDAGARDERGKRYDLAGSNAWFRAMSWVGTPEECRKRFGSVPVGACLFILEQDGREPEKYRRDGIGNASHIGIYTGTGKGAWHSSASRGCVAESAFSGRSINGGWNRVGIWRKLSYGEKIDKFLREDGAKVEPITVTPTVPQPSYTGGATVQSANGGKVNVRKSASKSAVSVAQLPPGTPVEIMEQRGGWSRIVFETEGWIMTQFLSEGVG